MENKCHKATYNQEIGLLNFDVFSERKKLLLTLRIQIEEISNMLPPKKKLSHQICNIAEKLIQTLFQIFLHFTCGNFHS